MIHEDGTMDVNVGDKTERRRYSINQGNTSFRYRYLDRVQTMYAPELQPGEDFFYTADSDVPVVVKAPIDPFENSDGFSPASGEYL